MLDIDLASVDGKSRNIIHLSLDPKKPREMQKVGDICQTIIKMFHAKTPFWWYEIFSKHRQCFVQACTRQQQVYEALVISASLKQYILHQAYNTLTHNGTVRTYHDEKCLNY